MIELLREGYLLLAAPAKEPPGPGTLSGWAKDLFNFRDAEFWVLVAFILFVGVVAWKARGAILGALDGRAARIRAEIDEAQRLREEAQALLADYQRKQKEALSEAEAMLRGAEEEAKRLKARAEIELAGALKRREQQALAEVRNLAADLAVAATEKILRDKLDPARAEALVSDSIAELPRRLQ